MIFLTEHFSIKVFLVLWRECFEAALIIGILYGFLRKEKFSQGINALWMGLLVGVVGSLLVAWLMVVVSDSITQTAQMYFEILVMVISALLMTHMVFWMRKHGRFLKRELESELSAVVGSFNLVGIASLTALALLREGIETVIFLYGLSFELKDPVISLSISGLLGFGAAGLTFWSIARGMGFLKTHQVFKMTEVILLLAAGGLLVNTCAKGISEGFFSPVISHIWNSEHIIPADSWLGHTLSTWLGYSSSPSLLEVMVYLFYWLAIASLIYFSKKPIPQRVANQ